jgi:hypothetical protein
MKTSKDLDKKKKKNCNRKGLERKDKNKVKGSGETNDGSIGVKGFGKEKEL